MYKTKISIFLLVSVLFAGCASKGSSNFYTVNDLKSTELRVGENLVQSFPIPETGWKESFNQYGGIGLLFWERKETGDFAMTKIDKTMKKVPANMFKLVTESELKKNCSPFDSSAITSEPANGYERVLWLNECGLKSGKTRTIINLFIKGKNYGYHLTRMWDFSPSSQIKNEWVDYFKSVSVCDTQSSGASTCPVN